MRSGENNDDIKIIFDMGDAPEATSLSVDRPAIAARSTPKSVEDTWAAIQELIKSTTIVKLHGDNKAL